MSDIHISIVSHGQWEMIYDLLKDLDALDCNERLQITITHNLKNSDPAENDEFSFPIKFISNQSTKGFGENHNNIRHPQQDPLGVLLLRNTITG